MARRGSVSAGRIAGQAAPLVLGCLAVSLEAAPLGTDPLARPSPDLLFAVLAVWALRRAAAVPVPLVFALGLMRDMVTDLPVGLGALSLVAAIEILRARRRVMASRSFLAEWSLAAAVLAGMLAMQWTGVVVSFAQPPFLVDLLRQFAGTLAVYPVIALLAGSVLRRRWRAAAGP